MLRRDESETEILLGNKQLIGIFFVVAILLGIAFAGGYMVGRGPSAKKVDAVTAPTPDTASANPSAPGGETHSIPPDSGVAADQTTSTAADRTAPEDMRAADRGQEAPLGSPKRKEVAKTPSAATEAAPDSSGIPAAANGDGFAPQAGQQFLQVAAVGKDEAEAVADVLHKKGFRAHAVPKPGNTKLYRVIIGPIRDAGDLSSTRDALVRTGFREVIVQRY